VEQNLPSIHEVLSLIPSTLPKKALNTYTKNYKILLEEIKKKNPIKKKEGFHGHGLEEVLCEGGKLPQIDLELVECLLDPNFIQKHMELKKSQAGGFHTF
jgi:hypothetical protein